MDIEDYTKLLEEKEWKEKRDAILKRDDYTCQKCGKRGFSYRAFIFSGYSEIDELMNGCTIDGQSVSTFLKSIEWKDKTYIPMQHFESKYVSGKRFIISFKDNADERSFLFAANDYPLHPSYIKYENNFLSELKYRMNLYHLKIKHYFRDIYLSKYQKLKRIK